MNLKNFVILTIIIFFAGGAYFLYRAIPHTPAGQPCTQEAKLCPDGTAVGRTGPNCEFSPCPNEIAPQTDNDLWQTFTDEASGISFQYPKELLADYISTVDWPPKVSVTGGAFICDETPGASSSAARTLKRLVDNRAYCVQAMSEGAAGSVYTDYIYTTVRDTKLITITFTLRFPQCYNYDDPAQTNCLKERESFDLDGVVDRIASSVTF